MKNLLSTIFLFAAFAVYGQINFGIKAGLNYNANNDLRISGGFAGINETFSSEAKLGYTIGFFGSIDLGSFYVRPEFLFSQTNSSYDENPDFTSSYLDIPILIGYNIVDNFSFYVGPSAQFLLNDDFSSAFDLNFDKKSSVTLNLGANLKLGKLGIDLRYLKGLSNITGIFDQRVSDGFLYQLDAKPSQLALSVSYQLN